MRNILPSSLLALSLFSSGAHAEGPSLPSDFFNPKFGKIEDAGKLKQVSAKTFQLRQRLGNSSLNNSGEILNFVSFCVAYGLSRSNGFSGFAITMQPIDDSGDKIERLITIALVNGGTELTRTPSPTQWSDYVNNFAIWNGFCKNIVNPQFAPK
ncbi:MAG: hypothetical protein ACLPXB_17915 [Thiobacillaceae bacterium]